MGKDVDVGTQGQGPEAALREGWEHHIASVLETENTHPETKEGESQLTHPWHQDSWDTGIPESGKHPDFLWAPDWSVRPLLKAAGL